MQKTTRALDEWFNKNDKTSLIPLRYISLLGNWLASRNNRFSPSSFASPSFEGFAFVQLGLINILAVEELSVVQLAGIADHSTLAPLALRHLLSMALPFLIMVF